MMNKKLDYSLTREVVRGARGAKGARGVRAVIEFFYSSSQCHVRHQIHDFNFFIENGGIFFKLSKLDNF